MAGHPLAARLRTHRTAAGLSLPKAAARVGVHPSVLGSWERDGKAGRTPNVTQLDQALNAYGERLAAIPADVTDDELAAALQWLAGRRAETELAQDGEGA